MFLSCKYKHRKAFEIFFLTNGDIVLCNIEFLAIENWVLNKHKHHTNYLYTYYNGRQSFD